MHRGGKLPNSLRLWSHKQIFSKVCNWMIKASCSCLWQIFNNRWQFTDIPVCSWQYPDVNGCSCLVTSPISSEIQGKMSRWEVQSVLTIMKGHNFMFNTVTDYSCGLMAAARCNKVSMYKLWHRKQSTMEPSVNKYWEINDILWLLFPVWCIYIHTVFFSQCHL